MQTLTDLIWSYPADAQIVALRAVANSSLARAIGSIRQSIRQRQQEVRDPNLAAIDLDVLNERDMNERAIRTSKEEMGFEVDEDPLFTASKFIAVHNSASIDLDTLTRSKWDAPMSLEGMLQFMLSKSRPMDLHVAKALATELECDVTDIAMMHEMQERRDREQLQEALPEIISTFQGHTDNGHENAIEELSTLQRHQLAVKLVEAFGKARNNVAGRIMRSKRLDDLALLPIYKNAKEVTEQWVNDFETQHIDEIQTAVEQGRARTLADI
jgi:hypothetical protein